MIPWPVYSLVTIDYELELALRNRKKLQNASPADAKKYIAGYTIANR
jgi:2-keto-4-pentenoate hydratase/2-oxohepta-3-ene-1,7-dioic acid hydratase in catechol pathway